MTHYETLDIPKDAPLKDVKRAYRDLAKNLHPDTGGDEEAFKELNRAYSVLSDADKREFYDLHGDIDDGEQKQLDDVLASMVEEALDAEVSDITKHILKEVERGTFSLNQKARELDKREERLRKSVKRVKCKRGSDPVTNRFNAKLASLSMERGRIEQAREALEYVKGRISGDFDFEVIEKQDAFSDLSSYGDFMNESIKRAMVQGARRDVTDDRDL